jgi:hypothetical protein
VNPPSDARPPLPGLRLPLPSRGVAPGAVLAVLVHASVIGALVIRAHAPAGRAPRSAAPDAVNFFLLPRGAPATVDVALAPHVPLADLSGLRRLTVELPPVELPRSTLPLPMVRVSDGTSGAAAAGAGGGPGTDAGAGAGAGAGPGTGDEAGYILHAAPRTAILPPLAQVPGSVAGRTLRVSFWVAADGRVTRVEVDPPIADAAYNREFRLRMLAYQFYPAHTRGGRTLADVVTVPLRIGN